MGAPDTGLGAQRDAISNLLTSFKDMQRIEEFEDIHVSKPPVIEPGHSFSSVTEKISAIVLKRKLGLGWLVGFAFFFSLAQLLPLAVGKLLYSGVGIWGNNVPVAWAFDIINFVWWIGIGHAGTLISAILLLLRQSWRTSINRFAEAMTLFAVACAGLFPALHTGRPWMDYYLFPLPNTMGMWPNFKSPLMWVIREQQRGDRLIRREHVADFHAQDFEHAICRRDNLHFSQMRVEFGELGADQREAFGAGAGE